MDSTDWTHVTPDEISAYVAGTLGGDARATLETHCASCDECRTDLIVASEGSVRTVFRKRVWLAAPVAAAAVAAFVMLGRENPAPTGTAGPLIRGEQAEGVRVFDAISPIDGAGVSADSLDFTWRSEGPGTGYRITLTSELGDVLWTHSTTDTTVVVPLSVGLQVGESYFWRVDALLEGIGSSTTGFQGFRVNP